MSLRSRSAIRSILAANLGIFVLFVVPVAHRLVDDGFRSLERVNAGAFVGRMLQVWLVGSTVVVTALFGRLVYKKASPLIVEATMLLVWWFIVIAAGVYGYAVGMGG